MIALDCPTWAEIERESLPVEGPFQVRPSRLGYVWSVVDSRTDAVRATAPTAAAAQVRADEFNRAEL